MTLVDAKYDNFTRFFYDAVTPVCKLLFEKIFFSGTFWHLVEQALIEPELQIFKKKKIKKRLCVLVFTVIFETYKCYL